MPPKHSSATEIENSVPHDEPVPLRLASADDPDNERLVAPEGYRPHYVAVPAVVDDDLKDTERMNAWRDYFASGSNRPHWFLIDQDKEVHMVEMVGLNGSYEASGPGYSHRFENAYDAFWTAEVLAKTFTDTSSAEYQNRG